MNNANLNFSRISLHWLEPTPFRSDDKPLTAIQPPPQFQDSPPSPLETRNNGAKFATPLVDTLSQTKHFASTLVTAIFQEALATACKMAWSVPKLQECQPSVSFRRQQHCGMAGRWSGPRLCWTPELLPFSPCHHRPGSRSSLSSSRLSSSHNSLAANKADDSSFITSAMSHDVLTNSEISDMYNVPFDSDIYAVPIDVVKPINEPRTPQRPKRQQRHHRKRKRQPSSSSQSEVDRQSQQVPKPKNTNVTNVISSQTPGIKSSQCPVSTDTASEPGKRHSVPGSSASQQLRSELTEPIHMTLQEVRQYLQNLYSSSSDSSENKTKNNSISPLHFDKTFNNNNSCDQVCNDLLPKSVNCNFVSTNNNVGKHKKKTFVINIKNKNAKDSSELSCKDNKNVDYASDKDKLKRNSGRNSFSTNLKQTLCNIFRIRKPLSPEHGGHGRRAVVVEVVEDSDPGDGALLVEVAKAPFLKRALPPLPAIGNLTIADTLSAISPDDTQIEEELEELGEEPSMDFASSIEKVKDYGWYWGPISGEAAERILSNEPDGSFIVRDSSDDHYIFSLTFKLNGCIRHVRIEHDQGNFSFGSCTKFKSHTIVDFIENAVEHSRSGRYLFFLHRRPVLGPMRVQLLHPVSRYKQVQSLQHMCRFVILKLVRRDLIETLPLPRRVIDYLSTPHYYSEQMVGDDESPGPSPTSEEAVDLISFVPDGRLF